MRPECARALCVIKRGMLATPERDRREVKAAAALVRGLGLVHPGKRCRYPVFLLSDATNYPTGMREAVG